VGGQEAVIGLLRRLATVRPIAAVLKRPRVESVVSTVLRGANVRELPLFVVRELRGTEVEATYQLRGSRAHIAVRHGGPDVLALDEIFYQRHYELPARVESSLRSLGRSPVIIDLGANVGLFGAFALTQFPEVRMLSVEPDPWNLAVLRRCVEANRRGDAWKVVEAVAATDDGEARFVTGRQSLSHIAEAGDDDAELIRSIDVFPHLVEADLVKMDIEGGEWAILADPRLGDLHAILVLEYHPQLAPEADTAEAVTKLLSTAGFELAPIFHRPDGVGMLWAWPADERAA
jgi:FkbM family methyltransferase